MTEDEPDAPNRESGLRLTAAEIFEVVVRTGEEELKRSSAGLAFSGLAAGLGMGLTGLGSASLLAGTGLHGETAHLFAALLYPLGFIVVIVGRAQLFTENTLFPVLLVLDRRRHLRNTLRLWGTVYCANILGALLFAALAVKTPALPPGVRTALSALGRQTMHGSFAHLFWAGILGGWIIALMAWLVSAARFTIGQLVLIYVMTFVVGAAGLAHCIAGSGESLAAVLSQAAPAGHYLHWLAAATAGNTVGGVLMVSLLNYAQIIGSGRNSADGRPLAAVEDDAASPTRTSRRRARSRHRRH